MTDPGQDDGLRHRKRTAAMARIQAVALDLFDERGYEAVTVEQIAEASDISPSSVYRYFGTKEQIVLLGEFEFDASDARLATVDAGTPLEFTRQLLRTVMGRLVGDDEQRTRRQMRLVMSNPALEVALAGQVYAASETLGEVFAARLERPTDDLEVQVLSHVVVGALLGGLHHWHGTGFAGPLRDVLDRCLDLLERGLQVGAPVTPTPAPGGTSSRPTRLPSR
ncbi:TetR/AcrR family transcriptional regulator [Actinotalea sp. M2MS4P-6]|uniref:TetR/AcrR family transcriptional regulator n=1 Tax=Actinotalea sp. M2MS4P-6 TaxID=2983762 RepID=UPI0021E5012D|nr:TetR/AcrR family transcriptional regulator [Actinotalea sp. M2MS4P-6]MCV2393126.1 TetR/AcrR family transcriptional regulator [Actinotalea sp. M2MS4P-6]